MKISQTAREAAERIARLANDPRLTRVPFIAATLTAEIIQSAIDAELADLHAKDSVRTKEHNILTQENRRLAEDAARLDWLENEAACFGPVATEDHPHPLKVFSWELPDHEREDGTCNIRAAIDAAREKSAP